MQKKSNKNLTTDRLIGNLRWLWIVTILALTLLKSFSPDFNPVLWYVLGAGIIYSLVLSGLLLANWFPDWGTSTGIVLDTILAIALMVTSGGDNSFLFPLLLFPVIISVLKMNPETGLLITALPITLAYAGFVVYKVIILQAPPGSIDLAKIIGDVAMLFGAGILAGYIPRQQYQIKINEIQAEMKGIRLENERAKAIYEMANTLSSTLNYHNVLNAVVELSHLALAEAGGSTAEDRATVGMVLLFEDGKPPLGKLKQVAGRNLPRLDEGRRIALTEGLLAQVIYKGEAMIIGENAQSDPGLKEFMAVHSCQSAVCAPLRAGFDIFGVVVFANPGKDRYNETHASLLTTFCNQATIALQNAQLYEDLSREQKKQLEKEAQARHELARNLHDGPTQSIAAIAMRLNFVQKLIQKEGNTEKVLDELSKIEKISLRTTQEIRTMLFTMRPIVLETQGLAAAIQQYADRLRDLDKLNIELDTGTYNGELPTTEEGVIFSIIEEAVGNAKKYAQSSLIKIKLASQNGLVIAEVADNGQGFDVEAVKSTYDQRGSLGLINMDERAQMAGGRCQIQSVRGKGTTVRVEVPVGR